MIEEKKIHSGIGKRKTSVAKVYLKIGKGDIQVNGLPFDTFFIAFKEEKERAKIPLFLANLINIYDINIKVRGGGIHSQLEAVTLGIAKAICDINSSYRSIFTKQTLLRRDSRIKERRKYGLKKARKASQYSKR
jgi:small subunit ribosomal protein S9